MSAPVESKAPEQQEPEAPAAAGPSKSELKKKAKEAEKEKKRIEREAKEAAQKEARQQAEVVGNLSDVLTFVHHAKFFVCDFRTLLPRTMARPHCTNPKLQNVCLLYDLSPHLLLISSLPSFVRAAREFINIGDLSSASEGKNIYFRARIHNSRAQGAKMVFFELRQGVDTIQALIAVEAEKISKQMVKWSESLSRESLVLIDGTVQKPKDLVKSTSVQDAEIKINKVSYFSTDNFDEAVH